jgi:iron complex transport system substrate-binding protein
MMKVKLKEGAGRCFCGLIAVLFLTVPVFLVPVPAALADSSSTVANKTIIDRSGCRIIVKKPFRKIISLYGAHTENLFTLGLDAEIIGVSKKETYPPKVKGKPVFSYHDDAEKFIAARPDLVLIRPMIARGYRQLVVKLRRAGIVVVSLQPRSIDELYEYWRKLGILTGREAQAADMIRGFIEKTSYLSSLVRDIPAGARKKVYFEAIHSRMKTFSPSSIAIFALTTAGGINVANDASARHGTNIAAYGKEKILAHAAEVDVFLAQSGTMNRVKIDTIKGEPGFMAIKAVRAGRIYIVKEQLVSRPTLRLLQGICIIGSCLYPEIFKGVNVSELSLDLH